MREDIAAHVGQQLSRQRIRAQISLRDLGTQAHISAAGLSLIENGKVLVPLDTLFRLCAILHCDPRDMLPSVNGS